MTDEERTAMENTCKRCGLQCRGRRKVTDEPFRVDDHNIRRGMDYHSKYGYP